MKLLASSGLVASLMSLGVLAQGPITPIPGVDSVLQFGAVGVLAWAVYWLLARHIPAERKAERESRDVERKAFIQRSSQIREDFAKHLAEQRDDYMSSIERMGERSNASDAQRHEDSKLLRDSINGLRANCARVQEHLIEGKGKENETTGN